MTIENDNNIPEETPKSADAGNTSNEAPVVVAADSVDEFPVPELNQASTNAEGIVMKPDMADSPAKTEEDEEVVQYKELPRLADSETVEQEYQIFTPFVDPEFFDPEKEVVAFPSETTERINEYFDGLPNIDQTKDLAGQQWTGVIQESYRVNQAGDFFRKSLRRKGAKFRQVVKYKDKPLAISAPKFNDSDLSKLTGQHAVIRMRAMMGMGHTLYVPLWNSGFWISMRSPSETALLDLYQRLEESKIRLGRDTYGLAFSNMQVFFMNEIFNFMIEHLHECTLKDSTPENLLKMILQPDLNVIVHALACLVYPKGFQYVRSILDAGGKERKIIKQKINIWRTYWADTSQLTDRQIMHMANRNGSHMTNDSVLEYRKGFLNTVPETVKINDVMDVTYRVPNAETYFLSGQRWVNGIVDFTKELFATDIGDVERNNRILNYARATNMRVYGHWVESMAFNGNAITDQDTMENMLSELSANDEVREKYFETVRNYIDDITITVIALPSNDKEEIEATKFRRFPTLIPFDPLSTFFILLGRKVRRITERD